ncbi:sugar phosphate isomerase/epimerase family protein [Lachnoclostridium edouardi]|uniref:sugar phosphate isomerase/epimerase family protein n=1 Tax=Lachnoclostridium edouardi TaxID=1926283 RepID=UPI000C7E0853|nr:sugar phosphate isomerase/epimerase family protein [Lachnoclostridium edouardi]
MKLSYQVAAPDVKEGPGVTAYQGDIERSFERLKETGYEGAELMVCNPKSFDWEKIRELSQKYKLEIPMICTGEVFGQDGLTFSDTDNKRRDEAILRAMAAVDLAQFLGAQINVGRLRGGYMFGQDDKECIARSVDGLSQVASYAGEKKVYMALEPVNPIASNFINTTQEGLEMLEIIKKPYCSLMLDSNHMFISDLNMFYSIRQAKGKFTYVHLADSNRLYPGNCKLDFSTFIQTLKETGYDGWVSVEVFQRPDQDTALEKSFEYLNRLIS